MTPDRTRTLLIASLALNLFVLGGLVGAGVMYIRAGQVNRETAASAPTASTESLWALSRRLTPEHRDALQAFLRHTGDDLAAPVHRVRTARRHAAEAVGAPVYDAVAVTAAINDVQSGEQSIRSDVTRGLAPLLAGFSPDERRLLADAVLRSRVGRPSDADRP